MNVIVLPNSNSFALWYPELQRNNLREECRKPIIAGYQQYRYTLRRCIDTPHEPDPFIAFFCWYQKPAVQRSFNPRPRLIETEINSGIVKAPLSAIERQCAEDWIEYLRTIHPVPSRPD